MLRIVALLPLILLFAVASTSAEACSSCSPTSKNTMLTELDSADIAFIAELTAPTPVRTNVTAFDLLSRDRQRGEAAFIIRRLLRGKLDKNVGEEIVVPLRVPGTRGALHLITHNVSADRWHSYALSDDGRRFAEGIASLPVPDQSGATLRHIVQRLEFSLRFLATDDFLLRRAIFAEISRAPYDALRQLRAHLRRDLLHVWLQRASKRADETRQVFLLMSVGGDAADVPMLKREVQQCIDSNWAGTLDAIIVAYVALGGIEALDDVDRTLLSSRERSVELKRSAADALRLLVDHGSEISRPRLLLSCRLLLQDPATVELIVRDMARWEKFSWTARSRPRRINGRTGSPQN